MTHVSIRNVRVILTAPDNTDLVIVKVETSEPGLIGLGCATFTQRALAVAKVVDAYLAPRVIGRDPQMIEDTWQSLMVNGYWRNGPVLNAALSGIDMALWDIKGKLANMPVYQLLGGKCRQGLDVYRHADGRDPHEVEDNVRSFLEQGYRYVRCQMGGYGGARTRTVESGDFDGNYFDPQTYVRSVPRLFEHLRVQLGPDVELLHDVHERLDPSDAVRLAKDLDPYHLFFLEDLLPPEHLAWFNNVRMHSTTPLAVGELFTHPLEWVPLLQNRLIDFIRIHLSQIGGFTPARKIAMLCETFGVRTAWHGPQDVSPVGHMAQLHLGISSPSFGIQEWSGIGERTQEVFPGWPTVEEGRVYLNDEPGWGIQINEELAARYPCHDSPTTWTLVRKDDGSLSRP